MRIRPALDVKERPTERRFAPRRRVRLQAQIITDNSKHLCSVTNMSATGMAIIIDNATMFSNYNTPVTVVLLADGESVRAKIIWYNDTMLGLKYLEPIKTISRPAIADEVSDSWSGHAKPPPAAGKELVEQMRKRYRRR